MARRGRLAEIGRAADRAARGVAWLFALGSLAALAWLALQGGAADTARAVMHVATPAGHHAAPGLTYPGTAGAALLYGELAIVLAAVVASMLRAPRLRRLGHAVLLGWCGLWLANAMWIVLVVTGPTPPFALASAGLAACFAATAWRAATAWSRARAATPVSPAPPVPTPDVDADDLPEPLAG